MIELYKMGQEKIISFYPDFEVKPEAINNLDFNTFSIIVEKAIEHGDECIQHEYQTGYFESEQNFDEFKENTEFILKLVGTIFPDYYKS